MSHWPLILVADNSSTDTRIISEVLNSEFRIALARNGVDALSLANKSPLPDLVLLEVRLPDMDGIEVCRRLKQSSLTRNIPVIFVTAEHDESKEALALDLQAADYITKPYSISVARARIRNKLMSTRAPGLDLSERISLPAWYFSKGATCGLSGLGNRQREILTLIAEGMTSAEIAEQLSIAKGTVEVHRENIRRKLGVRNIAGLVKCAIRSGLLHP